MGMISAASAFVDDRHFETGHVWVRRRFRSAWRITCHRRTDGNSPDQIHVSRCIDAEHVASLSGSGSRRKPRTRARHGGGSYRGSGDPLNDVSVLKEVQFVMSGVIYKDQFHGMKQ